MSSSRRPNPKLKASESNENNNQNPSDSISLQIQRSPLISIQDPAQIEINSVKGAALTPKSAQIRSNSRSNCWASNSRVLKGEKSLEKVEVEHFELNEDSKFWEDHNVQVLIRIRPISNMESALQGHKRCLIQESSQTLLWAGHPETRFTFDHVVCETISQEKLFRVVGLPMVDNCMSGYNSCMFAYGQTGSGKTYTMMGEIQEMNKQLSNDRGMTPRIFEYLFLRIKEEEERQREENLKYSCKCSFLEIYNEQIIDLLEPTSTNLQLREDIKKGVYVENLKEYEVSSVKDVMDLLLQGAANRKMASTYMNRESSRSHSVFACVIESRREIDSMTHLRFGRLNLVDLAGSERQKSSGAEGERLKEAANINRSLSTLGLVIMTLVDITNGKNRHVPYRDSRLTFLLQDSLGGNSKTAIIANVSPSICSANETLSTLKFAQRAKLIQNDAKVNEDASGDVMALQHQIQILKDQLTILVRRQNTSPYSEQTTFGDQCDDPQSSLPGNPTTYCDPCSLKKEIKKLENSLIGALRREELAEAAVRKFEDEIKHLSRLIHQREDDAQRAKTLLRFREEKLRRLELLADDLVTSDGYLMEENFALTEEIQLLRETIDKNPELTHFALENKRLLEQLRMYQNFYQQGERDTLLAEVSYLRNQLLKVVEGNLSLVQRGITQEEPANSVPSIKQYREAQKELSDARLLIKEMESQQAHLLVELNELKQVNQKYLVLSRNMQMETHITEQPDNCACISEGSGNATRSHHLNGIQCGLTTESDSSNTSQYSSTETRNEEFDNRLSFLIHENAILSKLISERDSEMHTLSYEWEKAIIDLTTFLTDGCRSLDDASEYIESVVESFPLKSTYINEHVERAIKIFMEKETLILDLQRGLEDAQKKGMEMKLKLDSLRGATLAITEIQQLEYDENSKELAHLRELLSEKACIIDELESDLKQKEECILEAEKVANAAWEMITKLYNMDSADSLNVGEIKMVIQKLVNDHTNLPINNLLPSEERVCYQGSKIDGVEIEHALHDVDERTKHTNDLLLRFEAVQETMEEAEQVVKALLKANEVAKHEKDMIFNRNNRFLTKILDLTSTLGESFQKIQRLTLEELNAMCAGLSSFRQELKEFIFNSRLCVEDMISEVMENGFELFVTYQCHKVALFGETMQLKRYPDLNQTKHNYFSSVIKSADFLDSGMISDVMKDQQTLYNTQIITPNTLNRAKHPIDASISNYEKQQLSATQHCSQKRVYKPEREILNLRNDMELLNAMIRELVLCSYNFIEEWTSRTELLQNSTLIPSNASFACPNEDSEIDINVDIAHSIRNDTKDLLYDIQRLKTLFMQPISSKSAKKDYSLNREPMMLNCTNAKTELGSQTLKVWTELTGNLQYLLPLFPHALHSESKVKLTFSLLEKSFEGISNIEVKTCKLLEKCQQYENMNQPPSKELMRKDKLIKGLLFDLSLLQESSSNAKSIKDELEEIAADYYNVCHELDIKISQMEALKSQLSENESELFSLRSELERSHEVLTVLSDENKKLTLLLDDAQFKYSQTEELLEDKQKVIEGLQSEILSFNSSIEGDIIATTEEMMNELKKICNERDCLQAEIRYLNDRLEMASALADENEAVAVEARQIAEASKIYAEEKEEEVKVLEHSVEELEDTINILEKKVYDMKEEVKEHHSIRRGLEIEVQALKQRMLTVENAAGNLIAEYSKIEGERRHIPRELDDRIIELCEARQHIEDLEIEKSYTEEEIKQYREHISELVLHSEAQSSLYQEKYKTLEAMVSEVKDDSSKSNNCQIGDKIERTASRTRGSGSPFRCISSLVQQMNLEKEKELSEARHQIEELEALAANRQKEICMLTARLAATDSMTHDVIRDLMGVKLDISNYANLIDQEQIQNFLQKAQQQSEETIAKEQENLNLKKYIDHLIEERESWLDEINQRKADILASEVMVEGLQQREQMLMAQNEMLKIDKANLRKRIAELDEKLKFMIRSPNMNSQVENSLKFKQENSSTRAGKEELLSKRLAQSDKLLSHVRTSMKNKNT